LADLCSSARVGGARRRQSAKRAGQKKNRLRNSGGFSPAGSFLGEFNDRSFLRSIDKETACHAIAYGIISRACRRRSDTCRRNFSHSFVQIPDR
jgi:hypothetical protein